MKKNTLKLTKTFTGKFSLKVLFFLSLLAASCNQNNELILDLDLNEFPDDTIIIADVHLQTLKEDSLRTDNLNFNVLGEIKDSVFGPSTSSIYTQLGLGGSITIPNNAEVDSIVLSLAFIDYYGNIKTPQSFDVYLLADSIDQKSPYYNTSKVALGPKLGSINNFVFGDKIKTFKVDITKLWGINALQAGKSFSQDEAFRKELFGLAIVPRNNLAENEGAFFYFNLISGNSYVNAYYHYYTRVNNKLETVEGIAEMQFRTNSKSFTSFTHNYNSTPIESALRPENTNADRAYIQALGGTYVSIEIPELKNLAEEELKAFHKVELVLPCETEFHNQELKPISFLDIKSLNNTGQLVDLPDRAKVYWVRAYNPTESAYIFNITSHVQTIVNGYRFLDNYQDNGLVIKAIKNEPIPFSAGRFVVKGSSALRQDGAYLRIYYSEIEQP